MNSADITGLSFLVGLLIGYSVVPLSRCLVPLLAVIRWRMFPRRSHPVSAVWLRRVFVPDGDPWFPSGVDRVQVLVEIGGVWFEVISDVADTRSSRIFELKNHELHELRRSPVNDS